MGNIDWKKLLGPVLGLALAAALGWAAKSGIEIPCPNPPSAVIQGK